jgi:hypothetical protein
LLSVLTSGPGEARLAHRHGRAGVSRGGPDQTVLKECEVARTWLSIQVDLIEGHGEQRWPRPGRIFAAARSHTFKQLADAIDDAFAR